ncbi:MAG: hypothetical protein IPO00_05120 [Betaproteobacteria bacterium]|nr:hypothetical protein [Betaproteobacteria bacterium]
MKQIQYSVSAVRKKNRWSVSAYFKGTREIADAHFLNDNINTWQLGAHSQVFGADVKIDLDAIMLPLSRGYGSLPSLHLAMSENPTLKKMVRELAFLPVARIGEASGMLDNIMLDAINDDTWRKTA